MAINVNVISEHTTFTVENANYCTVALPITACWGPCFTLPTPSDDSETKIEDVENALENTAWSLFNAGPDGLESFIATFRGPSSNYRATKDYSYFTALTLLNAGYTVQVCRLCPGTAASVTLPKGDSSSSSSKVQQISSDAGKLIITAKYPGTFGNNLQVTIRTKYSGTFAYWNLIGSAVDSAGNSKAVENLVFVFNPDDATDSVPAITEVNSKFFTFRIDGDIDESVMEVAKVQLAGGADVADASEPQTAQTILADAIALATKRYGTDSGATYLTELAGLSEKIGNNKSLAEALRFNEWIYTYSTGYKTAIAPVEGVYDLLKDKINYNPNRVIAPWDDQDILAINPDADIQDATFVISPLHRKLMDIAYFARCATAYIDVPRSLPRNKVWNDSNNPAEEGYAQKLSSIIDSIEDVDDALYPSSSALFAPWGQYVYSGTTKQATATPSFMALLIDRAMIKNQAAQYEWALPNTRNNNVKLGQLAYTVPKKLLDVWQKSDGTRINTITVVPSLGTTIWGNATLFDVPVATYQALANLSTRKLVNAIKDTVYKIGIGLEFQYNGQEAYAKFYAGVTPLLDTMRNVGAIIDYKVKMSADMNNVDSINANSVVGTVYLVIAGVIENITVDLIALPQGTDLSQY